MSGLTEQRLALSRILLVTALRDPVWALLLRPWLQKRLRQTANGRTRTP